MRGIERTLDLDFAVALLAAGDVALGEIEVVEDTVGIRPELEEIVVLEEVIMSESGVRDDQGLHRRRVFLHQIGDAGRTVDDDFIGKVAHAATVESLVMGEMLAEGPMAIEERHAGRRVGIQHLFRSDDLDLIWVDIQAEFAERDLLAGVMNALERWKIPVGAVKQQPLL